MDYKIGYEVDISKSGGIWSYKLYLTQEVEVNLTFIGMKKRELIKHDGGFPTKQAAINGAKSSVSR